MNARSVSDRDAGQSRRQPPLAGIGLVAFVAGAAACMLGVIFLDFNHHDAYLLLVVGAALLILSVVVVTIFFRRGGGDDE